MADFIRALVSTYRAADLPIDYITNTVYFEETSGVDIGSPAWTTLATDIAVVFATYRTMPSGYNRVNVRLYDMEDPVPRQIKGEHTHSFTAGSTESGPREVALCLSFYPQRNLPRNRGRLYLGPWTNAAERPSTAQIGSLGTLKTSLANIGGTNVQWCVYSPTTPGGLGDKFKQVSNAWVDDEWDTVRSRGLRAINRNLSAIEG